MGWDIVGRQFTPEGFETYVQGLRLASWRPEFIVLHNTASPSLARATCTGRWTSALTSWVSLTPCASWNTWKHRN